MLNSKTIKRNYYSQSIEDLINEFNTNPESGLTFSEIEKKKIDFGSNELPKIKKSIWRIYLSPLFNFLIVILIVTGIIIIILGDSGPTVVIIFIVVIINSATAIIQQYRAQKVLESLIEISALRAKVIREGDQMEIQTNELVPGDIVMLNQGDKIPADGRIIEHMNLIINEAPLTGESEPIEKNSNLIAGKDLSIQNQKNMVFMGTFVQAGRAKILITRTGINTEIGKISQKINEMGNIEDIPLTRKLNRLGYILGIVVIINLIILIIYKFALLNIQGNFIKDEIIRAIVNSILRAMNVVPINLPLLSTLVLITGVLNMAQSGVIIKNLSSIESLGRVSVICSDKTGTITKNEMTIEKFWINEEEFEVSGSGYDADGEILKNGKLVKLEDNPTFQIFIDSITVNNNAKLVFEDVKVRVGEMREKAIRKALGSPTEAALLILTEKTGVYTYDINRKYKKIHEFSFSSETKRMTTICNSVEDKSVLFAFSKGAPENIMKICSKIEINGKENKLEEEHKHSILKRIQERANQGFRTLAIGYKILKEFNDSKRDIIEKDLIFLGFVSIMDPPRIGVKKSVKECKNAEIKVVMITGDHPATAQTIATQMGIYQEGNLVILGNQIRDLNKKDFNNTTVFARVEPSDKEIIVEHYQKEGKIVAMTGDGMNDCPALKLANAGVAMGITGTDLAKETSDMIITDDNFTSIERGVRVGRGLFSKIRTIIYFFICLNIMEAVIFFSYEFIPTFDLFASNWQHVYIFCIAHTFPSLALVLDIPPKDVMKEPPRNEEDLLNKNMWIMLLFQAFLMGMGIVLILQFTLGGFFPFQLNAWNKNPYLSYIPFNSTTEELIQMKARTMFMTTLFIAEIFFIWSFRRPNKPLIRSIKEDFCLTLFLISLFTLSIHALLICYSYPVNVAINHRLGLNLQLNFMFLSITDWLLCFLFALPGIFGVEILKFFARKRNIYF